jgi:hypothetical protein
MCHKNLVPPARRNTRLFFVDYGNMRDGMVDLCLAVLRRSDVKGELKTLLSPLVDPILDQLYPYIYLSLLFVIISFFLHLGILFLLVRNRPTLPA